MFKIGGHVRDIGFVIIYVQAQYNLIARKTTGGFFQDKRPQFDISLSQSFHSSLCQQCQHDSPGSPPLTKSRASRYFAFCRETSDKKCQWLPA